MDDPVQPQQSSGDDPMLKLRYYKETGQNQEAQTYEKYLRATGQYSAAAPAGSSPPASQPGVLARAASRIGNAVMHPIDTAESIVSAPFKSAADAFGATAGEAAKWNADPAKAPIPIPPTLAKMLPPTKSVTPTERVQGAIQTAANVAFPSIAKGASSIARTVPYLRAVSGIAGKAAAGSVAGAAYSPDDPAAGALAGAAVAPVASALGETAVGAVNAGRTLSRIRNAPAIGDEALAQSDALKSTAKQNFATTTNEAAQVGGTTPAVQQAFQHPIVQPLVDAYRASHEGQNATDAQVGRKVDQMMTKQRRALETKNALDYDPTIDTKIGDLKAGQKVLRSAIGSRSTKPALALDVPAETHAVDPTVQPERDAQTGPIMEGTAGTDRGNQAQVSVDANGKSTAVSPRDVQGPAGPAFQLRANPGKITPGVEINTPAMRVQTAPPEEVAPLMGSYQKGLQDVAQGSGERRAFDNAVSQTRRVLSDTKVNPKKLDTQGGPAFLRQIQGGPDTPGYTTGEANQAETGTLGAAKEFTQLPHVGPHSTLFGTTLGAIRPFLQARKISPFLDAIDRQRGQLSTQEAADWLRQLTTPSATIGQRPDQQP